MSRKMSILFTSIEAETLFKLNNSAQKAHALSALSITHGAVFAPYSSDFIHRISPKETNTEGFVPDILKGKMKQKFLDYLKNDCGMRGVHAFLTSFVSSLATREKRREKKAATICEKDGPSIDSK